MRIIITGANGYLGNELVTRLADRHEVLAISRKPTQGQFAYDVIEKAMTGADAVIHCAAITKWFGDKSVFHEVNEIWSFELAQLAASHHVSCFVFISSIAVYGFVRNKPCIIETDLVSRRNNWCITDYGRSKATAEKRLATLDHPRCIMLRCGLIYDDEMLAAQCQRGFRQVISESRMPYVHVLNVVAAIEHSIQNREIRGPYNLVDTEQPYAAQLVNARTLPSRLVITKTCIKNMLTNLIHHRQISARSILSYNHLATRQCTYSNYKLACTGYIPSIPLRSATSERVMPVSTCKMRVALVGFGGWGRRLFKLASTHRGMDIIAICESEEVKHKVDVPVYRTISGLLSKHHIDGAIIATPNHLHARQISELAPHVRHLYVEKPLCNSTAEYKMLQNCIRTHHLCLTVGHSLRFSGFVCEFKKRIEQYSISSLVMKRAIRATHDDWRSSPLKCPGGVIPQLGIHLFDIALFLMGNFKLTDAVVTHQTASSQVLGAIVHASAQKNIAIRCEVEFGQDNILEIDATTDNGSHIVWNNGVCVLPDGASVKIPFDDGVSSLLAQYRNKWFLLKSGISDHDAAIQEHYLACLSLLNISGMETSGES